MLISTIALVLVFCVVVIVYGGPNSQAATSTLGVIVSPIVSVAAAYFGISLGVEAAKDDGNKKTTGNDTPEPEEKEAAEGLVAPTDQTQKPS